MNLLTGASLLALVKSIYYRVSERPDTDPKGHNQARKTKTRPKETKGDKRAIFSHGSFFFSRTHAWVSGVASYPAAFNIRIIIFIKCNHK